MSRRSATCVASVGEFQPNIKGIDEMARGGFFAQLQRASRQAARDRERNHRAAVRAHDAAVREAERSLKQHEQALVKLARASEQDRRRLEKEAREARIAARELEVEERNSMLEEVSDDLDSLLSSTLAIDDHVDLAMLKGIASHPPFDRTDLEAPAPLPVVPPTPPRPDYDEPPQPTGLAAIFGKRKHAASVESARARHEQQLDDWRSGREQALQRHRQATEAHAINEALRLKKLAAERRRYEDECSNREQEVAERNQNLDELIANLGYGSAAAIQEYLGIVLANSAYPEHLPITHVFDFEPTSAELRLRVSVPAPDAMPTIKSYRYVKSSDEILSAELSLRAKRERYADVVNQVALRSFHEVFESDRRGLIKTVSLEVGTEAVDPATGRVTYVALLAAAADRDGFASFDLSAVVPTKTLEHLGASVSKSPYELEPAVVSGVRRS